MPRQARWADFLFVRHEVTKELTVNTVNTWVTGDRNRIYSASAEDASKIVGCFAGGHHMTSLLSPAARKNHVDVI